MAGPVPRRKPILALQRSAGADGLAAAWLAFVVALFATASWLISSGPPPLDDLPAPVVVALEDNATPSAVATASPAIAAEPAPTPPPQAATETAAAPNPPAVELPAAQAEAVDTPPASTSAADSPAAIAPTAAQPAAERAPSAPAPGAPAKPAPAMLAAGAGGTLPVIAADGRQPWQAYARAFDAPADRPRVAIILADLGLNRNLSAQAITQMPPEVTLAFSPYAADLTEWLARARAEGHEVLLMLPMEPNDYPSSDPGPRALMTSLSASDNLARLEWLLARAQGYAGVATHMGSKFTASADDLRPILTAVRERGLLFVDTRSSPRSVAARLAREADVPFAANSRFIDNESSAAAIDARLNDLERIARSGGGALGVGFPHPLTLARVAAWAQGLPARGIALAPVSAVVLRPAGG